jgi:hypothetical protein
MGVPLIFICKKGTGLICCLSISYKVSVSPCEPAAAKLAKAKTGLWLITLPAHGQKRHVMVPEGQLVAKNDMSQKHLTTYGRDIYK